MNLALSKRPLPLAARRGPHTIRNHGRRAVVVQNLMGSYQYNARIARLRVRGANVRDFGQRVLQQGSYGDDVMQLQAYLSEQGYFNSTDGLSGYFGAVTAEALQGWQRDLGLRVTGVFNEECKWAYLKQQEAAMLGGPTRAATPSVAVATAVADVAAMPAPQFGLATGVVGFAAAAVGVGLAASRLPRQLPAMALRGLSLVAQWALRALTAVVMAAIAGVQWAVRTVVRVSLAATHAARELPLPRTLDVPAASGTGGDSDTASRPAYILPPTAAAAGPAQQQQRGPHPHTHPSMAADGVAAPPHAQPAPQRRQLDAEEAAYLAAEADMAPRHLPPKPRKLSEDELQQRIAVMKGELSPRAPPPQRPAPRPLPLDVNKPGSDPITGSKYGTYYGGREVREKVKQYLENDGGSILSGMGMASSGGNPARGRLQSLGYQMNNLLRRPGSKPAKPAGSSGSGGGATPVPAAPAAPTPAAPKAAPKGTPPGALVAAAPVAASPLVAADRQPFRDVLDEAAAAAVAKAAGFAAGPGAPTAASLAGSDAVNGTNGASAAAGGAAAVPPVKLLNGTELEKAPERRGRPVPVVKPGMASPMPAAPASGSFAAAGSGGGAAAAAPSPPRPVPVVKPQKRATIGDMLRASRMQEGDGDDDMALPPAAALYPVAGGFGFAPVPPSAGPPPPPPAVAAAPQGPRPVNTGSSYSSSGSSSSRHGITPAPAAAVTSGSSYSMAAPMAAQQQQQPGAAVNGASLQPAGAATAAPSADVQYNPDGSVVLASKPIRLVKPARLLPKTVGFEDMSPPPPPMPAAVAYEETEMRYRAAAAAATAADGSEQQPVRGQDMQGGYRRRRQ